MRLIAQLFLIFIYLFTSLYRVFDDKYCARPVANAALDEAQTDCIYIKLAIYYVFFSRKITFVVSWSMRYNRWHFFEYYIVL